MRLVTKRKGVRPVDSRLAAASAFTVEAIESRTMLSGVPITAWNFNNDGPAAVNLAPAPSTGTGTAASVGMSQPGTANPGLYPTTGAIGPDGSSISAPSGTSSDGATGFIWKVVGTKAPGNGWNTAAGVATQGAQFLVPTTGYNNISLQFDWGVSSNTANGLLAIEYTLDANDATPLWTPAAAGTLGVPAADTLVTAKSNTTNSPNTIGGAYFQISGSATALNNGWQNGLTADFSAIPGANNNPNFGVRIVNAATGADAKDGETPTAPPSNTSGNWRFDQVQILGTSLPVNAPPAVTTNPVNQTVAVGSTATFTAAATGYPTPTVQWQVSIDSGATFNNVTTGTGGTTTSYTTAVTTSANNNNRYRAVFHNTSGADATTTAATLTVQSSPVITTQPTDQTVTVGNAATFIAAATGSPTPTVQWQVSTNHGTTFADVSGATSATYSFTPTESQTGNQYRAVFTSAGAPSSTTNAATLTVVGTPISQWIFTKGTASAPLGDSSPGTANDPLPTLSLHSADSALAIGFTGNFTGVSQLPESDITQLASGVNPSYKPYVWRVRAGNGGGPTGNPGTPEGWSQNAPQYSQGVVFKVDTTGFTNITLRFDWNGGGIGDMQPQYTPDGGTTWINAGPLVLEQNDYYGITPTTVPTGVLVNLQGVTAADNNPNFGIRLVSAYDPALPLINDGNLLVPGLHGQYSTKSVGAVNEQQVVTIGNGDRTNITGGTFTLTYAGQTTAPISFASTDPAVAGSNTSSNIAANATNIAAALGALSNTGAPNINVVATDATGTRYTVTFTNALGHVDQPEMTASASGLTGASPAASVATWQPGAVTGGKTRYADGGGAWSIANFSFNGFGQGGLPAVSTQPASQTVVGGTLATFTASTYSEVTPVTAQWQVSIDNGQNFNNIPGATNINGTTSTYSFTTNQNLSESGYEYRVVFTNSVGSAFSAPATLTVVAPAAPVVTTQPLPVSVVSGNVAVFTATASGSPSPTVQWQVNSGSGWSNFGPGTTTTLSNGSTVATLTFVTDPTQDGKLYRALFSNVVSSVPSNGVKLTVLSAENTITQWDFATHPTTGNAASDNSPLPTTGAGTLTALGFDLKYDGNDGATGDMVTQTGSVNADDVAGQVGLANPTFTENLWRIRGGVPAPAGSTNPPVGGTPANGWSNFAKEKTQGAQFKASTVGFNHIYVTLDWYTTKSGIRDAQEQYTLDGTNFIDLGAPVQGVPDDYYGATLASDPIAHGAPIPLVIDVSSIAGAANNPNFAIRLVAAYDALLPQITDVNGTHGQYANVALADPTTAVVYNGSKGNWRFDNITFHGLALPTVAALSPATGSTAGGTSVVITGTGFTGATAVNFGTVAATSFTVDSATQITAITPAEAAGTVNVTVTTPGGISAVLAADQFTFGTALPSWLSANSIATYNTTTHVLTVTGATTIIADPGIEQPIINATGAAAIVTFQATGTVASGQAFHLGGLTLASGAKADVKALPATGTNKRTHNNHVLIILGQAAGNTAPPFTVDSASGSKFDLEDNDLIVHHGNVASVRGLANTGRNVPVGGAGDGTWDGLGLTSSAAAAADTAVEKNVLAVTLNSQLDNTVGSFNDWVVGSVDETLSPSDVIVKYTYNGDFAFEGMVGDNSYSVFSTYFNRAPGTQTWTTGDTNGDGNVNDDDYSVFSTQFNRGTGGNKGELL